MEFFFLLLRISPHFAAATLQTIELSVDRLAEFPKSGRQVPELNDPFCREIIVDPYRVIYEVGGNSVNVLSVLHGARSFPTGEIP